MTICKRRNMSENCTRGALINCLIDFHIPPSISSIRLFLTSLLHPYLITEAKPGPTTAFVPTVYVGAPRRRPVIGRHP